MLIILLVWPVLYSNKAHSKELGVFGAVFPITEPDLLDYIQKKLQSMKKSGELAAHNKAMQDQTVKRVNRPNPVRHIHMAVKDRKWWYDPSVALSKDLYDHEGVRFYKRGTRYNPLDKITLTKDLVFIDGDETKHVRWALEHLQKRKGKSKIILVKGNIIELMREHKLQLYFDQHGSLTKKFQIQAVPASVEQVGRKLQVREYYIP